MVADPADYTWSSYRSHAFGRATKLWEPHQVYLSLAECDSERQIRYRALFEDHVDADLLVDVRQSINQGLALGSEKFRKEIEALGGRRQSLLKRGPRPKEIV